MIRIVAICLAIKADRRCGERLGVRPDRRPIVSRSLSVIQPVWPTCGCADQLRRDSATASDVATPGSAGTIPIPAEAWTCRSIGPIAVGFSAMVFLVSTCDGKPAKATGR